MATQDEQVSLHDGDDRPMRRLKQSDDSQESDQDANFAIVPADVQLNFARATFDPQHEIPAIELRARLIQAYDEMNDRIRGIHWLFEYILSTSDIKKIADKMEEMQQWEKDIRDRLVVLTSLQNAIDNCPREEHQIPTAALWYAYSCQVFSQMHNLELFEYTVHDYIFQQSDYILPSVIAPGSDPKPLQAISSQYQIKARQAIQRAFMAADRYLSSEEQYKNHQLSTADVERFTEMLEEHGMNISLHDGKPLYNAFIGDRIREMKYMSTARAYHQWLLRGFPQTRTLWARAVKEQFPVVKIMSGDRKGSSGRLVAFELAKDLAWIGLTSGPDACYVSKEVYVVHVQKTLADFLKGATLLSPNNQSSSRPVSTAGSSALKRSNSSDDEEETEEPFATTGGSNAQNIVASVSSNSALQPGSSTVAPFLKPPATSTSMQSAVSTLAQPTTPRSKAAIRVPKSTSPHTPSLVSIPGLNLISPASNTQASNMSTVGDAGRKSPVPASYVKTSAARSGGSIRTEISAPAASTTQLPSTSSRSSAGVTTATTVTITPPAAAIAPTPPAAVTARSATGIIPRAALIAPPAAPIVLPGVAIATPAVQPTMSTRTLGPSAVAINITAPTQKSLVNPLPFAHAAIQATAISSSQVVGKQTAIAPSAVDIEMDDSEAPADDPKAETEEMKGVEFPGPNAAMPTSLEQGATLAKGLTSSAQSEIKDLAMDDAPALPTYQVLGGDLSMAEAPAPNKEQLVSDKVKLVEAPAPSTGRTLSEDAPMVAAPTSGTAKAGKIEETTKGNDTSTSSTQPQANGGATNNADTSDSRIGTESQAPVPPTTSVSSSVNGNLKRPDSRRKLQRWGVIRSQPISRRTNVPDPLAAVGHRVLRGNNYPRRIWYRGRKDMLNAAAQVTNWSVLFDHLQSVVIKQQDLFLIRVPVDTCDNDEIIPSANDTLKVALNAESQKNEESLAGSQDLPRADKSGSRAENPSSSLASDVPGAVVIPRLANSTQRPDDSTGGHWSSVQPLGRSEPEIYNLPHLVKASRSSVPSACSAWFSAVSHAERDQMPIARQGSVSVAAGFSQKSDTDSTDPSANDKPTVSPQEETRTAREHVRSKGSVSATQKSILVQQKAARTIKETGRADVPLPVVQNRVPVQQKARTQTTEDTDAIEGIQHLVSDTSSVENPHRQTPITRTHANIMIVGDTADGVELPQFLCCPTVQQWLPELLYDSFLIPFLVILWFIVQFAPRSLQFFYEDFLTPLGTIIWDRALTPAGKAVRDHGPTIGGRVKGAVSGLVKAFCKMVASGCNPLRSVRSPHPVARLSPPPAISNVPPIPKAPTPLSRSATPVPPSNKHRASGQPARQRPSSARIQAPAQAPYSFSDYRVDEYGNSYLHTFYGVDAYNAWRLEELRETPLPRPRKRAPSPPFA